MLKVISMLMKMKLKTSTSFRALACNFMIMKNSIGLDYKSPTHTTLLNWIHKIGYYELIKSKKKAEDWIIILDESIQFGQEKLLVILGIREKDIDFNRPLQFQDLVPLREITKLKWNGTLVKEVLLDLKEELGNIKYAVGDHGSYLKKGIELAEIKHIHDLTHKIGLIIKKICLEYPAFIELSMKIKSMRKKFTQTKIAHLKPPKLKTKCRYRNVMILSKWGKKIIKYLKTTSKDTEAFEKLNWLLEHESTINEFYILSNTICEIEKIMKNNGYNAKSKIKYKTILEKLNIKSGNILKEELNLYFNETTELLPKEKNILISSDIIESAFGKYKNYVSSNPMAGITNLILCISAFTSDLTERNIQKALEETTINHVREWTKEFVGDTLLKKRRLAFCE